MTPTKKVPEKDAPPPDPSAEAADQASADVDEALDESFPASDPPAWTTMHAGAPPKAKKPAKPD